MNNLSVIIPAYNEVESIEMGKLERVASWLDGQLYQTELIVVDDGSEDRTASMAMEHANRVITIGHKGKAGAIITGFREASHDVVMFTDMDQATPITEADKLLETIVASTDIAVGSRGLIRKNAPIGRYILSWGHYVLHRLVLGLRIDDTQCGFKAFKRDVIIDVLSNMKIYNYRNLDLISFPSVSSGFDTELLFVAQKLGYKIKEVPVEWNYQETRRVDLTRDALRGIVDLYQIACVNTRGGYKSIPK